MIIVGPKIKPPKGYLALLMRNPGMAMKDWYRHKQELDCTMPYDQNWVWSGIRNNFTYKADSFDKWTVPDYTKPFVGDCEDFALACRKNAVSVDILSGRLLLCKERKPNSVAHCVYLLGEWVLDCRLSVPCDINTFRSMYTLYAVSSVALMGSWYRVKET